MDWKEKNLLHLDDDKLVFLFRAMDLHLEREKHIENWDRSMQVHTIIHAVFLICCALKDDDVSKEKKEIP